MKIDLHIHSKVSSIKDGKKVKINTIENVPVLINRLSENGVNICAITSIIIGCPVWAGHPAPAFNAIVELLPAGKEVELFLCSGGSGAQKSEQGTKELIERKDCTMVFYRDVKTGVPPGKMKND